jgi:hypothetical protein
MILPGFRMLASGLLDRFSDVIGGRIRSKAALVFQTLAQSRQDQNGFPDGSTKSFCKSVSMTDPTSILSASVGIDSWQRISADSSKADSVNFRSKAEFAAVSFFLVALTPNLEIGLRRNHLPPCSVIIAINDLSWRGESERQ